MSIPDRYQYVTLIGSGYFSIVKEYTDASTGARVAIKTIKRKHKDDKDIAYRFRKEIEFLKTLTGHDHIIQLIAADMNAEPPYYVMPRADMSLDTYIGHNNNSLGVEERLALFGAILDAVRHAHASDIYHRDICPHNVLLFNTDSLPTVRVCDFGLGKDSNDVAGHTRSSVAYLGHAYYVAPEQEQKLKSADARSDVYSLGKLLNYILTGRVPKAYEHCSFGAVVKRATKPQPEQRYQSVDELSAHIDQLSPILLGHVKRDIKRVSDIQDYKSVDWDVFHKVAVEGDYEGHVYYGYLDPVIDILNEGHNLRDYIASVGDDIESFVDTFVARMNLCVGQVGWPFSATTSFTRLLRDIFDLCDLPDVKVKTVCEVWDTAFQGDQWASQPIARDMLRNVPETVTGEVAAHIANGRCTQPFEYFTGHRIPNIIMNAIATVA